jgi:ABC-2 type transport system ATP-binding protein
MRADGTISIRDLRKSFDGLVVLDGINLNIKRGMVLALLGPNGAGKTTTVRILSTLISPDSGEILVNGYNVVTEGKNVRAGIGLTGQYAAVDEYLTGRENLEMIAKLYRLSTEDAKRRAQELIQIFDMVDAADRSVKTYSGGMRRRIDLAMSLIASPSILFLDEPTTGLDPRSRLNMWAIIKQLAATDVTVLLTTQYMEEADYLADRIVVIDKGKVIAEGTANELKAKVGSERVVFTISESSNFEQAEKLIGPELVQADKKRRTISISGKGVGDLRKVLGLFEEAKIGIDNLSLHRPTLDDVFLTLTGHGTVEDSEQQK